MGMKKAQISVPNRAFTSEDKSYFAFIHATL